MIDFRKTIILVLLIALGVFIFLYFTEKSDRLAAENKYAEEKKQALRELSDSLNIEFTNKAQKFQNEINYLSNLEQDIKYVPYEKIIYTDRSFDEALDVFANHPANRRTTNNN